MENKSHFTRHFTSAFNSSVLLKVNTIYCKVQLGDIFGEKIQANKCKMAALIPSSPYKLAINPFGVVTD